VELQHVEILSILFTLITWEVRNKRFIPAQPALIVVDQEVAQLVMLVVEDTQLALAQGHEHIIFLVLLDAVDVAAVEEDEGFFLEKGEFTLVQH
jgi:hypothetical protein